MGRKVTPIVLTYEEREFLETQTRTRTIQAQTVARARILLLKADGLSTDDIADKVDLNRKSVLLCIKKFHEGGIENALYDAPGRGRNAEITDDEKAWIINIACQKPVDLGYSAEVWTRTLLTKHTVVIMNTGGLELFHSLPESTCKPEKRYHLSGVDIAVRSISNFYNCLIPNIQRKIKSVWF